MDVEKGQLGIMERFALAIEKYVPDAITSAVVMIIILFVFATGIGTPLEKTGAAYYKGFWMLLAFTMQMTLIITLSAVFGQSPFFRKIILMLSVIPKTPFQVIALASILTGILAYLYWGLAITLGPVIAVYFCGEAEKKGIKVDLMVCLATVFASHSIWQYGLSSSGPLLMATPGHFLEKTVGILPSIVDSLVSGSHHDDYRFYCDRFDCVPDAFSKKSKNDCQLPRCLQTG